MDKHNTIKNAFEIIEELNELIEIERDEAEDDPAVMMSVWTLRCATTNTRASSRICLPL